MVWPGQRRLPHLPATPGQAQLPGRLQRASCRRYPRCGQAGQARGSASPWCCLGQPGPARYHRRPGAGDGIGRRSGLKTRSRKVYGFESRPAHQGRWLGVAMPCRHCRGVCWRQAAKPLCVGLHGCQPGQMVRASPGRSVRGPLRQRRTAVGHPQVALPGCDRHRPAPRWKCRGWAHQARPSQAKSDQVRSGPVRSVQIRQVQPR